MFFLMNRTQQVTLHPSYFGKNMRELVTSKLLRDIEGTCTGSYYIISVMDTFDISEGRILPGNGLAEFTVGYRAVVWKPFMDEIVDAVVDSLNQHGFFAYAGPAEFFVSKHMMPEDVKYQQNATIPMFTNNEDFTLEKGTQVRLRIRGLRSEVGNLYGIGTMAQDYLGVLSGE